MMYGWNNKPAKAKEIGSLNGGRQFEIGWKYIATLHEDGSVTYHEKYRTTSDPRSVFPNMTVDDGEIRIAITDLVEEVLKRLEPRDLAVALWENDEVRAEFMDCLVTRHNERGIDDSDRRKFLDGVQAAVHAKALDVLADKMASLEYNMSKRSFFYHEVNRVNEWLHEGDYKRPDGTPIRLQHEDSDPDFRISGKHWNESRSFWRDEVLKQFPMPEPPHDR